MQASLATDTNSEQLVLDSVGMVLLAAISDTSNTPATTHTYLTSAYVYPSPSNCSAAEAGTRFACAMTCTTRCLLLLLLLNAAHLMCLLVKACLHQHEVMYVQRMGAGAAGGHQDCYHID